MLTLAQAVASACALPHLPLLPALLGFPRPCSDVQGSGPPSALLCGGAAGHRSGDILGCAVWELIRPIPISWEVPTGHLSLFGMWAQGSLASCAFLCFPCPSASNSCLSLSPFPSVCVRLLTGRIQVSSGNTFSLPWGCVRGSFLAHSSLGWSCCSRGRSCPANKLGRDERHRPGWE